jgi:hypothetical protein
MGTCNSISNRIKVQVPKAVVMQHMEETLRDLETEVEVVNQRILDEWHSAQSHGKDYDVMGGKAGYTVIVTLKKHIKIAENTTRYIAYEVVAKGTFPDEAAARVWSSLTPYIEAQRPKSIDVDLGKKWIKANLKAENSVKTLVKRIIASTITESMNKH